MHSELTVRMRSKRYEQCIVKYAGKNRGCFICVTDDVQFTTLLRTTLVKQLGLGQEALIVTADATQLLRIVRNAIIRRAVPLVFMERIIDSKDMSVLVRQIKNAFTEVRVIVLTNEAERQRLVLLHEVGADNFITKPVSINALIEKIAFTIKPQGKLGQLVDLARTMISQGNPQQALKVCKQILEIKSNSAAAFLVTGDAFRALGKFERAREAYEKASKNAEMYLEPLRKLAELYGDAGDMEKKLHYLERLDQLSPLNVERKVSMGEIHLGMGNVEAADKLFDIAVNMAIREAAGYVGEVAVRVADIYARKDPLLSEKYLRRALEAKGQFLGKDDIGTFNRLGILLRNQGKWREALVEYQKAARVVSDDENLYYNMGMACAEGRNYRDAQTFMLRALALNPALPSAAAPIAYNMALIFMQNDDRKKALECLRSALERDPDFTQARTTLERLEGEIAASA